MGMIPYYNSGADPGGTPFGEPPNFIKREKTSRVCEDATFEYLTVTRTPPPPFWNPVSAPAMFCLTITFEANMRIILNVYTLKTGRSLLNINRKTKPSSTKSNICWLTNTDTRVSTHVSARDGNVRFMAETFKEMSRRCQWITGGRR